MKTSYKVHILQKLIVQAMLWLLPCAAQAQNWGITPSKPKLVVQIVVPQMHHDHLAQHWARFGDDGFKLLVNNGVLCAQAHYGHQHTQSWPGLATLSTGADPAVHGIVANRWYLRNDKANVQATADPKAQTVGGSFGQGMHSAKLLLATTLADELWHHDPQSKVIGIALEPSAAILATGHSATGIFWLDTERGRWVSSTAFAQQLPPWADTLNAKGLALIYAQRDWRTLRPLHTYAQADTLAVRTPAQRKRRADKLRQLADGLIRPGQKNPNGLSSLLESPFGSSFTVDMAIAAIEGEGLGLDQHTDFLSITFSPNRAIGAKHGPSSVEMEDAYLRLDADMAHLLRYIDRQVGLRNTLVVLTSDHALGRSIDELRDAGLPCGTFSSLLATTLLNSYLSALHGKGQWVLYCHGLHIYLDHKLVADKHLDLDLVRQQAASFMLEFGGVARSVPAQALLRGDAPPNAPLGPFQRSYNCQRSGDVLLALNPGWVEEGQAMGNTAMPHHSHVPLVLCGWKVRSTLLLQPIDMVQLAPTLAVVLGLPRPSGALALPIPELVKMLED